ncbi:hypothetical protein K1719_022587 [Acacia pycnantha]|nr:hypothetical protein K1719_022587 [Acacia pycnantha]
MVRREIVNFASANYLGLIGHSNLLENCTAAIEKYGVGASSSRGFYGTFDKKTRRYIVVEAIYQNSGQIAPLDETIRLKEKYRFRILLDESNSFGVLGRSGKGLSEYNGVQAEKVDIIAAAMGHAPATEGGL